MRKRFVGKIALITGSSSGIGKAAAIGMAKEGFEYDEILKWYYTGTKIEEF